MGLHPLISTGWGGRKFRWMFSIQPFIGESMFMLPPIKAARPNVSFKEYQAEHLNETIYFPGKPEWATFDVTLYDIKCEENPIYEWLNLLYSPDPKDDYYQPSISETPGGLGYKTLAQINMLDGCGNTIESWIYMNAYPSKIDWGDVDMSNNEFLSVDLTIRYDRAYIVRN